MLTSIYCFLICSMFINPFEIRKISNLPTVFSFLFFKIALCPVKPTSPNFQFFWSFLIERIHWQWFQRENVKTTQPDFLITWSQLLKKHFVNYVLWVFITEFTNLDVYSTELFGCTCFLIRNILQKKWALKPLKP